MFLLGVRLNREYLPWVRTFQASISRALRVIGGVPFEGALRVGEALGLESDVNRHVGENTSQGRNYILSATMLQTAD